MAGDLKGLTVQIGGNTTELGKALDAIKTKTSAASGELKQINKLLKVDPGNTDLLAQKQKVLADKIAATKGKLELLNQAQKQAAAAFADGKIGESEYRKIERDVIAARQELDELENQARETGDALRDSGKRGAKETKKVGDEAEKSSNKLAALGKVGKAVGTAIATGFAASTAVVAALSKQSLEKYAEYEQLVGGVETLFGNSSQTVKDYAANAYKTAGMSANAYMKTVTSFSASLLQSLGGDTKKAASYADMAITDMSDNSNKMGTDMEAIQNAYNGFAKQNYTMLDNLKLGYGGTKEEMQRLLDDAEKLPSALGKEFDISNFSDIVEAIHLVQEEMGIAGTTAKEAASTIEGSVSSMKSAWENMLIGLSDENANLEMLSRNFIDSVSTAADNIIPRLSVMVSGLGDAVSEIIPELTDLIQQVLPPIMDGAVDLFESLIPKVSSVFTKAIPKILKTVSPLFKQVAKSLSAELPNILTAITDMTPDILEAVGDMVGKVGANIITHLPEILSSIAEGVVKGGAGVVKAFVNLFIDSDDILAEAESRLDNIAKSSESFADRIGNASREFLDSSKLLSQSGKTAGEIDTLISDAETEIYNILKERFGEQEGLRQEDLKNIRNYNKQIKQLEQEKLGIYQDRQQGVQKKIELAVTDGITTTEAAELMAESKTAYSEAVAAIEETYTQEITRIENLKTQGELSEDRYNALLNVAKRTYDSELAETEAFYNSSVAVIQKASSEWIEIDANKWTSLSNQFSFFKENSDGVSGFFTDVMLSASAAGDEFKTQYINALSEMDLETSNAFLSMAAAAVAGGSELDSSTKSTVSAMLDAFTGLPDELDEAGRSALDALISGLDDSIPELKNAATMSTDQIVAILRENFGVIEHGGFDFSEQEAKQQELLDAQIKAHMKLISEGDQHTQEEIEASRTQLEALMAAVTGESQNEITNLINSIENDAKTAGSSYVDGIVEGLQINGYKAYNAGYHVGEQVDKGYRAGTKTESPSKVARKSASWYPVGVALGIADTAEQPVNAVKRMAQKLKAALNGEIGASALDFGAWGGNLSRYEKNTMVSVPTDLGGIFDRLERIRASVEAIDPNVYLDGQKVSDRLTGYTDVGLGRRAEDQQRGRMK